MNRVVNQIIIILVSLMLVSPLMAQPEKRTPLMDAPTPPIRALSFKKWKDQQVTDAKNQVVRLSNAIHLLESKNYRPTDGEPKDKSEIIKAREADRDKALQQLQFSKELDMEDYYAVYLQQFANNPDALKILAKSLSSEELAELLQILLKSKKSTKNQILNPTELFSGLRNTEAGVGAF